MRIYMTGLVLLMMLWACGNSADPSSSSSSHAPGVSATNGPDGQKIYKQYCVACHGLQGDMGASGAFNLTTSTLSVEERVQVITKGRGVMTPFESLLDPEQIQAVAQYTLTLKKN
ncbi:MAG: cytochrome c [Saprospiraceae bacterium]